MPLFQLKKYPFDHLDSFSKGIKYLGCQSLYSPKGESHKSCMYRVVLNCLSECFESRQAGKSL